MRLSTDVFDAMDLYGEENIMLSNLISTGGRCGLIPVNKPFELSVNVINNVLEVVSLSCHGVTKSGKIVDIDFDSNFTNTFDAKVSIPSSNSDDAFLLIVKFHNGQWREVSEMYSEPRYTFELIGENSPIDRDSLPIGRLVNQYGWRLDEIDFVPPCIFISAHPRYIDLVNRAKLILKSISDRCLIAQNCVARHLLGAIWPSITENYIYIEKKDAALTPSDLLASLQKVIANFVIGCSIDEYVTLDNAEPFIAFYQRPYDGRSLYRDIQNGLELCAEISIKMDAVCSITEIIETPAPPVEKPKVVAPTPPESKPMGRNRWEGIEI